MTDDALIATSLPNNIRERAGYQSESDQDILLSETNNPLKKELGNDYPFSTDTYKAVNINEFSNGLLMRDALPDQFRIFAIEMMRQLQTEYNCQSTSEKATCELATMAFIRIFVYQQLMLESERYQSNLAAGHTCGSNNVFYSDINRHHAYFGCCACNRGKIEQQHYQTLGKELDRANRQYLNAIQTLRIMKQAPLQITVKVNTAIVGQNQMVQNNTHG